MNEGLEKEGVEEEGFRFQVSVFFFNNNKIRKKLTSLTCI